MILIPPLVVGCCKGIRAPLLSVAAVALFNRCPSAARWFNMFEEESSAVTAGRVKTLTTFPWSRFMQSIHPITGNALMLPC